MRTGFQQFSTKKRVTHPLLSCCFISLLQAVLFLELVNTSACIYKFLFTCKVGVTLVADFNLDCVCVFGCTCYKCCATSTYNSRFMIIWMYTLFHIAPRPLYLELCSTAFLFYYNKTNPSSVLCKFAFATFLGTFCPLRHANACHLSQSERLDNDAYFKYRREQAFSPVASIALLPALATNNSLGCLLYASRPTMKSLRFD